MYLDTLFDRLLSEGPSPENLRDLFEELVRYDLAPSWKVYRVADRMSEFSELLDHLGVTTLSEALATSWVRVPDDMDTEEALAILGAP